MFSRLRGSIFAQSASSLLLWAWSAKNYAEQATLAEHADSESIDEQSNEESEEQPEHWLDLAKRDQEQFWRDFLIEVSDGLWTSIEFKTIPIIEKESEDSAVVAETGGESVENSIDA